LTVDKYNKTFQNGLLAVFNMKEHSMKILQYPLVAIICLLFTFHFLPLHAQDAGNLQEKEATDTTDTSTA
jgi:hypothetical protein